MALEGKKGGFSLDDRLKCLQMGSSLKEFSANYMLTDWKCKCFREENGLHLLVV